MTEEMLLEQEKLIYSIANKFKSFYDIEDLYQVGVIGLSKAYKKYKEGKNTKFSTYAYEWIKGEILEYIRGDRTIKVSKETISLNKKIEHVKELMTQKLMREPTTLELSLMLDIDEEKILDIKRQTELVKSLDCAINEEENITLLDSIKEEEKDYDPSIQDLRIQLDALNSDEKALIQKRYFDDLTQDETSKLLGMTQVQVYRKEKKILKKLEKRLM